MSKLHVAVLMGGKSSEHDVSLASGKKVCESLDADQYRVTPVTITREGRWRFSVGGWTEGSRLRAATECGIYEAVAQFGALKPDCVFLALHGAMGEDGRIQGFLDILDLPYTSSGCTASGIAIDKLKSKAIVRDLGIRVAGHLVIARADWHAGPDAVCARVASEIGFPCAAKSPCQGSSVGMAIPGTEASFRQLVPPLFDYDDVVMVEQFVRGREVTCGVLDAQPGRAPVALPVTEIRPVESVFFDYHAKYTPGASLEITPADIPPELAAAVQDIAVRVHAAIGCSIWSRSDLLLSDSGPVWIEVNTIPGLTPTSLFPQAAAAAGISYSRLLDVFIEAAIARRK